MLYQSPHLPVFQIAFLLLRLSQILLSISLKFVCVRANSYCTSSHLKYTSSCVWFDLYYMAASILKIRECLIHKRYWNLNTSIVIDWILLYLFFSNIGFMKSWRFWFNFKFKYIFKFIQRLIGFQMYKCFKMISCNRKWVSSSVVT